MAQQRTVSVKVSLVATEYFTGLKKMQDETRKTSSSAEDSFKRTSASLHTVGVTAVAASAVLTAAFVAMIKASADFEQRMSQVQALSKATAGQMGALRNAAFTAGQAFGLSATQVADAQIELTKAGVSVKDIIGGALPGALALAAAGQIDVAKATEIASNAMTEFKLKGADVPHVADLLASGADKSVASVESLGDALNQSGLVASQFGLSVEDTVGTLTAFSKAGLNGSDAGTSFKTMLLSLASPSKQAQKYLDEYNITAYNSQGAFVGITNLASQLNEKLGKVSAAQRNAALSTIFGTDAIRSASVLYELGGKKLQGYIDANNEAGFAALQASKKLDNLNGDVQKLGASFQNDLIKSGSAGNDALRNLTKGATGLLDVFTGLPKGVQATALGLAGVAAAVTAAGGAFLLLSPKIQAARASMEEMNLTGKGLAKTFGKGALLTLGLSAVAGGLANLGAQGTVNADQLQQAAFRIKGSYKDIDKVFPNAGGILGPLGANGAAASLEVLDGFPGKVARLAANFTDGASAALTFGTAGTHLGDVFKSNQETFAATGTALAGLAHQDYSSATNSFNRLNKELGGGADNAQKLLRYMPDYNATVTELASTAGVAATAQNKLSIATGKGGAAEALRIALAAEKQNSDALNSMSGAASAAQDSVDGLSKTIAGFGGKLLDAHSAQRAFEQAVDDASAAFKKNGKTAIDNGRALDISTQAGRDNQDSLEGIASSADAAASKLYLQSGSTAQAAAAIRKGRKDFIDQAVQMGLTRTAAAKYADQLQLIPSNVTTALQLSGSDAVQTRIADIKAAMNNLNGTSAKVYIAGRITGLTDGQASQVARNARFASGGLMPNIGPKGKDSFLIAAGAGEYMLPSKDVDKAGGASGVGRIQAALRAGTLTGYATGGAIGDSTSAAARAAKDITKYTAQLKTAKATESRLGKAYDAIDSSKKNHTAKAAAKARDDAAKKKVDDLQKKLDDAKQARTEANTSAASLRNDREDFISGQRRATAENPIDPLSYVDQLRSMSRDDNFSASRRKSFDTASNKYEASIVKQQTALDKATTSLNNFKDAADSMKSSITSSIAGAYGVGGIASSTTATGSFQRNGISFSSYGSGVSANSIDSYYAKGASATSQFADQLSQLAKRGINGAFLAEIAQDSDGPKLATALLSATTGQIASINANYSSIQGSAASAAGTVTDYNYAALISDAQKNADTITGQIASDGEKLRKLIAQAFGLTGYAIGTLSATPGWHLMGEQGPELVRTGGGEQVATAGRTRSMIAAAQSRGSGGVVHIQVTGDDSVLASAMSVVADQRIASDGHATSVMLYGKGA